MGLTIGRVTSRAELEGVLALQAANLRERLAPEVAAREGFVTAEYTLELLERMHAIEPSVIAKDGERVVAYALVTDRGIRGTHPLLDDLFAVVERSELHGRPMRERDYVLCGQLCVAYGYRGQALASRLYGCFRAELARRYDCLVTDVARDNPRSLRAHLKSGFEVFATLGYGGVEWDLVGWDWRSTGAGREQPR